MARTESVVAAWADRDRLRAVLPADRELIDASATIRTLIVDLVLADATPDELFDACAVLGRMMAQRGGSPTLASATLDHLAEALGAHETTWLTPGRAAVAEGFVGTATEDARSDALRAWEYPSCAVPLGQAGVAIAAGYPSDDDETVAAWAGRVAKAAALAGVRRAVVSGGDRACAALLDAFSIVGIEVHTAPKVG
jgi:hypothetical protein